MKRTWQWALAGAIAAGWLPAVTAQVLQPIDTKRQADVNGRILRFDRADLPVIAQPTRDRKSVV